MHAMFLAFWLCPIIAIAFEFEPDFDNCGTGFGSDLLATFLPGYQPTPEPPRIVNGIESLKPIPWLVYLKIHLPSGRLEMFVYYI